MKFIIGFVLVVLALTLAGCGGSGHSKYVEDKINNQYTVIKLPYKGREVECIRSHFTTGSSDGRSDWGGISCDWVAYHQDQ